MKNYSEAQRHFEELFEDINEVNRQWTSGDGDSMATESSTATNMISFGTTTATDIDREIFKLRTRAEYNLARALHANREFSRAEHHYKVSLRNRSEEM